MFRLIWHDKRYSRLLRRRLGLEWEELFLNNLLVTKFPAEPRIVMKLQRTNTSKNFRSCCVELHLTAIILISSNYQFLRLVIILNPSYEYA